MMTRAPLPVRAMRVGSLAKHAFLDLYMLEGEYDHAPLRVLVADDGCTLSYFKNLVFPDGATVTPAGRIPATRGSVLAKARADLVIVGANLLLSGSYTNSGFHLVPRWVRLFLPSTEEPYARLYDQGRQTRKYFKWMLKKVADEGFVCESTNDPAWLETFYHDMYKPYAEERYGELAIVHSFDKIRETFSRGAGIFVKKDDKQLAGCVISYTGTTVRIPHFGVLNNDMDAVRDGAAFATDYYIAQMAHSGGYKYVDFGHSRPFLSDGALKYKLNWHMDVRDDDDAVGVFAIAAPGKSEQALKFLAANRFFELSNGAIRLCDDYRQTEPDTE